MIVKKFDVCLMNPPYDNGLGNKFLEKTLTLCNRVVTVQPIGWLTGKKQNKKITNLINGHATDIELINGNKYFDAGLFANLSVNYIDLTTNGKIKYAGNEYEKCEDIKSYSHDKYLSEFVNKLGTLSHSLWDEINFYASTSKKDTAKDTDYCIKIPQIRGHVVSNTNKESNDFFTIISNNEQFLTTQVGLYEELKRIPNKKGKYEFGYYAFKDKQTLYNFINYIKTDFVRTCLRILKIHSNQFRGCLANIPWQDFSNDIFSKSPGEIDDYLFREYKIDDDLRKKLEDSLPDYYNIRNKKS